MLAFLVALFQMLPVLFEIYKKIEGTPAEKAKKLISTIQETNAKFLKDKDTTNLGDIS